jgi:hypothetical protein
MRFIPTTTAKVETLKKQAKRLHRVGRGKHTELLDRVARGGGYEHWHHVLICLRETTAIHDRRGLLAEIEAIVTTALNGKGKAVVTGSEASTSQPFILIATEDGDAWMLDPEDDQALCLVWHGSRQTIAVRDLSNRIEIEWDGTFDLSGAFFSVSTQHPEIGSRYIAGYPVVEIRELLEHVRSADKRIEGIFGRPDAVPLSPDIISQLVRGGWEELALHEAARQGAEYSPSRNSLLFPPVSSL